MLDAPLSTRDSDLAMTANLVVCQLHLLYLSFSPRPSFVRCSFAM